MIILGVDPGIGRTGWAVIEASKATMKAIGFGCIETLPNSEISGRLGEIYDELSKIVDKYSPDTLAIEDLFFNTNAKTALIVGQARGVILLVAKQKKMNIGIYTPLQVKIAITGYGRAEKKQVGQMIKTILKLSVIPKLDDTTDALGIAIAHAFTNKFQA